MLAIRLQRTGRSGHAMFRVVVQDARRTPTSGKLVAQIGSYDPRTKQVVLDSEKVSFYLSHGAQPSSRVTRLLKTEKIAVPAWVSATQKKDSQIRHPEKLRRNRPAEPVTPTPEPVVPEAVVETKTETVAEAPPITEPEAPAPAEVASLDTEATVEESNNKEKV